MKNENASLFELKWRANDMSLTCLGIMVGFSRFCL